MTNQIDYESMVDEEVGEDLLEQLSRASQYQAELEQQIAELDQKKKELNQLHQQVSEETIPDLLNQAGVSELRLADGTKVTVKEDLRVSTTGKYRDNINAWLQKNGYGDLIKDDVTISFGRGQDSNVQALLDYVQSQLGQSPARKQYVESASFKSLVKELLSDGEDVPLEDLGVFVQKRAKLERS